MESKPEPEQCIKAMCQAMLDTCTNLKCTHKDDLTNVEGFLFFFFRTNGKCRIHLVGKMSITDVIQAAESAIHSMLEQQEERMNPLAS
jgi:hypothetical protein